VGQLGQDQRDNARNPGLTLSGGFGVTKSNQDVTGSPAAKSCREQLSQVTVLFFAANPTDQERLRLDEEVRAIGEMIRKQSTAML
jgi:hypothetical protein